MELLLGASLVAAFIAGMAALFAPCCITVLLPAYLASVFRERYKVFLMTFIFFLGILAVFLPIGLGAAALGQLFGQYHNAVFGIGGVLLILLGIFLLTGSRFSLPRLAVPSLRKHNALSVFALGIYSGIATTCCAPVLAGVFALAALPGSVAWGALYTLSFVLGMVAPLFLISVFLDKSAVMGKFRQVLQKPVEYSLLHKQMRITISEAISGAVFLIMGVYIAYLAFQNRLSFHSGYQLEVNIFLTKVMNSVSDLAGAVPEYVWAAVLVAAVALIVRSAIKQFSKN